MLIVPMYIIIYIGRHLGVLELKRTILILMNELFILLIGMMQKIILILRVKKLLMQPFIIINLLLMLR
jgi:hypothetical protein